MPALAPDSLVVVIGITGYVASHIGLSTLQVGHRVRGTFRDSAKAEQLKESYARHGIDPAKLELVKLDDLTSEEQYKTAFAGVDGVVHVALASLTNPNLVEVTSEAVMAALRAAASTPTVKRFVLTATAVTAYTPGMGVKGHLYTDKDWNMPAVQAYKHATDELKSQPFYMWLRYATAKTLSELAARKWMGEKKVRLLWACLDSESSNLFVSSPASTLFRSCPTLSLDPFSTVKNRCRPLGGLQTS